jgi:putative Holliday junction resolvase
MDDRPMRPGVRLGVDVGTVRIGVSMCDPGGLIASPVETVPRGRGDLDRLVAMVAEHDVVEVVVGLPLTLAGQRGPAAQAAEDFAFQIAYRVAPTPVRLVDERMSTVSAERGLRASGKSGKAHGKARRKVVDQAAAVIILQSALDAERATGQPPGETILVMP